MPKEGDVEAFFAKIKGNGMNDMIRLTSLTTETILKNLQQRFRGEIVYTWVGDIVISVNPFKDVGCVGKAIRARYKGKGKDASLNEKLMPHIYGLIESTFSQMMESLTSQSVLISGESGAGKTEAMKICLSYLGEVASKGGESKGGDVAKRLMQTNPVSEAIGNAKTVRNNNSSRFGKLFDVQFDTEGTMVGALTSVYLLEKPRICEHMTGERNYHVFYMLCTADSDLRKQLFVGGWKDYAICNQEGTVATVTTWDDEQEFRDMHAALAAVGFSEESRLQLYLLLSCCLHLGNIEYAPARVDGTEGSDVTSEKGKAELKRSASMLEVPEDLLKRSITTKKMMGGGKMEAVVKPLEPHLALLARNSLIMQIYSLAFDWVLDVINKTLSSRDADASVGILDVFGFENFKLNSFPQLCINYANEALHNLFIEHVFKLEQEVYIREEVEWNFVSYTDNQPVIDLISKRPICILGLLDEASSMGTSDDKVMLSNVHDAFGRGKPTKSAMYVVPRLRAEDTFAIQHFAGEVTYTVDGFLAKNKDELGTLITELLEHHAFDQLKTLQERDTAKKTDASAAASAGKKGKGRGAAKKTVGRTFGESLSALVAKLRATEHNYIRCLKPNQTLTPGEWDADFMTKQLAYSGALEVTQIRAAGLHVRRPLKHFYTYYKVCADDLVALRAGTITKRCQLLMQQLKVPADSYRVGKTIIFLASHSMMDDLDKLREVKIVEWVIILQSMLRMLKQMRAYRKARKRIINMQRKIMSWEMQRAFTDVRMSARLVQKQARCYVARKRLQARPPSKLEAEEGGGKTREELLEELRENIFKLLYPHLDPDRHQKLAFFESQRLAKAKAQNGGPVVIPIPKLTVEHEGWVWVQLAADPEGRTSFRLNRLPLLDPSGKQRIGSADPPADEPGELVWSTLAERYVVIARGVLSIYENAATAKLIVSAPSSSCSVSFETEAVMVRRRLMVEPLIDPEATGTAGSERDPSEISSTAAASTTASTDIAGATANTDGAPAPADAPAGAPAGADEKASALAADAEEAEVVAAAGCFGLWGGRRRKRRRGKKGESEGGGADVGQKVLEPQEQELPEEKAIEAMEPEMPEEVQVENPTLIRLDFSRRLTDEDSEQLNRSGRQALWRDKLLAAADEDKLVEAHSMEIDLNGAIASGTIDEADQGVVRVLLRGMLLARTHGARWRWVWAELRSDGLFRYFAGEARRQRLGSVSLRFFALVEHEQQATRNAGDPPEDAGDDAEEVEESGWVSPRSALVRNSRGKRFDLRCGASALQLAHPEAYVADEWLEAMQMATVCMYQKLLLFGARHMRVSLMDGTERSVRITSSATAQSVVRTLCRELDLQNEKEWALVETLRGTDGQEAVRRKLEGQESIFDVTLLGWEVHARQWHGLSLRPPPGAFTLLLRKVSALAPQARTPSEWSLEHAQAVADFRDGRLVMDDETEALDFCSLLVYGTVKGGKSPAAKEGTLKAFLSDKSPRTRTPRQADEAAKTNVPLHLLADSDAGALEFHATRGDLERYLPASWLPNAHKDARLFDTWLRQLPERFRALTMDEVVDEPGLSVMRKLVQSYRMEEEVTRVAAAHLVVERACMSHRSFGCTFFAELWSPSYRAMAVVACVSYGGLHLYERKNDISLCSFGFNKIVSWQALGRACVISVVAVDLSGTKTMQKLHLLTDESTQLTSLLSRYGRRVLDDLKKAVPAPDAPGAQQTPRTPGDGGASSVPGLNLQFAPPPMGASPTTPGSCTSRASCPTARLLPAPSARFNLVGDADLQSLLTARDLTFRPNPNDRTKTTPLEAGHLRTPMAQRLTAKVRKEAVSKNTYCV